MATIVSVFTKVISAILSVILSVTSSIGIWTAQTDTLKSIVNVNDTLLLMDYTNDYDLDTLLDSGLGNATTVGLVLYALLDTCTSVSPETLQALRGGDGSKLDLSNIDYDQAKKILNYVVNINGEDSSIVSLYERLSDLDFPTFGCTTYNAHNTEGDVISGRNYDYMGGQQLTVWTHPENGYASVSDVSTYFLGYDNETYKPENLASQLELLLAPYLPVDGINEKGLSISVLELETDPTFQMTENPDFTTSVAIRACLDKCATVDEAIKLFKSYDMHDMLNGECTYHYQITDAKGNTAIIEYPNGEMKVIRPGKSGSLVATNFWLTSGIDDPLGMGQDRYNKVNSILKKNNYVLTDKQAMNTLKATHCVNEDMHGYICSTLWSVVFNNTDKTLDIVNMYDYSKVYHMSVKNPVKYTVN